MKQTALIAGFVFAVALGFARIQAAGSGPLIFRETVDDTFVTGYCGFPMEIHTTGTAVVHLFLDDAGDFERVLVTAPETRLTFTNLDNGKSVWTPSVNLVASKANEDGTGTQSLRGLFWHLIVPGEGLITADVGRIDFLLTLDSQGNIINEEIVFSAGIQDGQPAFASAMCGALS